MDLELQFQTLLAEAERVVSARIAALGYQPLYRDDVAHSAVQRFCEGWARVLSRIRSP